MKHIKEILREKSKQLLEQPGVYVMYDEHGCKLYIGKSVNVRQRVRSYWSKSAERSNKIKRMIHLVRDFKVHYTDTELDALLLESQWIETFEPPYNTALTKSDRSIYFDFYTAHPYSLKISRAKKTRAYRRFGPFSNRRLAMKGYRYIFQNYPYFFCDYTNKKLNVEQCKSIMKYKCPGICETYEEKLDEKLIELLFDKEAGLEKTLEDKMNELSEAWEFEKAGELYEQIKGIRYIRTMNKWLEEARKEDYIGILPIKDSSKQKYYLVHRGEIIATELREVSEEEVTVKNMKYLYEQKKCEWIQGKEESLINTYQLLIIGGFKKSKMKIVHV